MVNDYSYFSESNPLPDGGVTLGLTSLRNWRAILGPRNFYCDCASQDTNPSHAAIYNLVSKKKENQRSNEMNSQTVLLYFGSDGSEVTFFRLLDELFFANHAYHYDSASECIHAQPGGTD
uniref:Uncharacterized protein n=1 Tax=Glossina morsitans morsitans TaxID=37546 RepID=A0A1B0FKF0_GLOMM